MCKAKSVCPQHVLPAKVSTDGPQRIILYNILSIPYSPPTHSICDAACSLFHKTTFHAVCSYFLAPPYSVYHTGYSLFPLPHSVYSAVHFLFLLLHSIYHTIYSLFCNVSFPILCCTLPIPIALSSIPCCTFSIPIASFSIPCSTVHLLF